MRLVPKFSEFTSHNRINTFSRQQGRPFFEIGHIGAKSPEEVSRSVSSPAQAMREFPADTKCGHTNEL